MDAHRPLWNSSTSRWPTRRLSSAVTTRWVIFPLSVLDVGSLPFFYTFVQGIQLVKRLQLMSDNQRQRAEVAVYFDQFNEAEDIYLQVRVAI